jgi:hypothetical protein
MSAAAYSFQWLTKIYGEGRSAVHVLRSVDLDIPECKLLVLPHTFQGLDRYAGSQPEILVK